MLRSAAKTAAKTSGVGLVARIGTEVRSEAMTITLWYKKKMACMMMTMMMNMMIMMMGLMMLTP